MAKKKDTIEQNVEQDARENSENIPDPRDARIKELEEKVEQLQGKLLGLEADHVFLGGQRYRIVHRNTVKELGDDMRKNFVDENLTAVVIEKLGG